MNLQQFRFLREVIRRNFNLTQAANHLHTSQPGISKAIMEFESELGVQIFERHGKRIRGLTRPGADVAKIVERINQEIENLRRLSEDYAQHDAGRLVIACTHTQARYALPKVIPMFRQQFPKVHLSLAEGSPTQIAEMVLNDEADVGMATETLAKTPGLVSLACYHWEHVLVCHADHPLYAIYRSEGAVGLQDLVCYPIVTYDTAFSGRRQIDQVFSDHDLKPDIVLAAVDSDVIKTYVDLGLGVGIIASVAFDPLHDSPLCSVPVGHLFGRQTARLAVRQGAFLRDFVRTFIRMMTRQEETDALNKLLSQNNPD
ncbi:CysB family HTH-type transcriptional regulator [Orrella sp. 11846]|uniref:CysB family HTH-type transcriptional regulator n=1 Tax=Orrella sp. 11846 TaxID=3409913 RepID=UPI003B5AFF2E